jgi:hypothetical protein
MAELYRGDLQDATIDDVLDETGERWDCREIMGGYVAVPREPGGLVADGVARCPRSSRADAEVAAVARAHAQGMSARTAAAPFGPGPGVALPYPVARAPPPCR